MTIRKKYLPHLFWIRTVSLGVALLDFFQIGVMASAISPDDFFQIVQMNKAMVAV